MYLKTQYENQLFELKILYSICNFLHGSLSFFLHRVIENSLKEFSRKIFNPLKKVPWNLPIASFIWLNSINDENCQKTRSNLGKGLPNFLPGSSSFSRKKIQNYLGICPLPMVEARLLNGVFPSSASFLSGTNISEAGIWKIFF